MEESDLAAGLVTHLTADSVTDLAAVGIDSAAAVVPDLVTDLAAVGIDSAAVLHLIW
jgi:hypothetical protein